MTETMRALFAGRGPAWELGEAPVPEPGPGEVLIRSYAGATNNGDLPQITAADPTNGGHANDTVAGYEYAGDIVAVGEDAGDSKVGDKVMGLYPSSYADYVVADHRFVLPRPEGLSVEEACTLPAALLTEFGALSVAGFEPGQSVLITGAPSGIGLIGLQIAKQLGASRIIATTRSAAKADQLRELGADTVIVDVSAGYRRRWTSGEHQSARRPGLVDQPRRTVVPPPDGAGRSRGCGRERP